ncbi:hypothetical protein [Natronorubrum texcoconense]|nr:hypothetical protein [Natronorubrum texcoconense]
MGLWVLATIGTTVETWSDNSPLSDRLGLLTFLIPNWNFFAPHPGQYDYHLLYRDKLSDGEVTAWTETTELTDTPQRLKWLWNPNLYPSKGLFDAGQELTKRLATPEEPIDIDDEPEESEGGNLQPIESDDHLLTIQYMMILNYVSKMDHRDDAEKTQFMLMRSSLRQDDATPMFVSNFHKL